MRATSLPRLVCGMRAWEPCGCCVVSALFGCMLAAALGRCQKACVVGEVCSGWCLSGTWGAAVWCACVFCCLVFLGKVQP
jgi:hypothetical protein